MSTKTTATHQPQATQQGRLESHRILSFRGPDAANFLQGYLTCDTDKLSADKAIAGAFTNLKGRVVASGWVWGGPREVSMLVPSSVSETVSEFLKLYMNFSKTKLSIASDAPQAILLGTASDGQPTNSVGIGTYGAILVGQFSDEKTSNNEEKNAEDLSEAWLELCLAHNEAVVTLPVSGAYLPQMLGLTELGAVAFDKGCYLGQEVVARAQHRGEVKRRLRLATYEAAEADQAVTRLTAGATLVDSNGKRLGSVICATRAAAQIVTSLTPNATETHQLFTSDDSSGTDQVASGEETKTSAFKLVFSDA